jgi:hypothetical protein
MIKDYTTTNMEYINTQQEINSFNGVFVVKNFLSLNEIRKTEEILDIGEWNTSDRNNRNNEDGTFYKWMPLLKQYINSPKNEDFKVLEQLDIKIKHILLQHAISNAQHEDIYLTNCGIFSSSVATPYYADNCYPVDSENKSIVLGYPAEQGFECEVNLDTVKTWKIREGSDVPRYSCALFLNNDFVGGGLVFPQLKAEIKPERNTLVIFPSTQDYVHGERSVKGVKNCFCSWYGLK